MWRSSKVRESVLHVAVPAIATSRCAALARKEDAIAAP
jgi:hypothetical protein